MKKIIIGMVLLAFCFILPFAAIIPLFFIKDHSVIFTGPGSREITVEEAKKYYIWNQYQGRSNDGKSFSSSQEFPENVSFNLTEKASGRNIPFQADPSISTSFLDTKRKSIGFFPISSPGSYVLVISNLSEERLISWSPSPFEKLTGWMAGIFALGIFILLCVLGAIVLIIIGIVDLSKKANPPTLVSQPPSLP